MSRRSTVSRRRALKLGAGVFGLATGATGSASALSTDLPTDVVRVNVGYTDDGALSAITSSASEVIYEFAFGAATVTLPEAAVGTLRATPGVEYVERDGRMEAIAQSLPWGVDRVDAEVAHDGGQTGNGADVAVIDTGIDGTHSDLSANLGDGRAFVLGISSPLWQDDNGHGTHVAGIADGVDNTEGVVGVSTEATLHAVKVLTAAGSGRTSDVAMGIQYTADQGWDVGNMSLGGSASSLLKDACEYAYSNGVLLVAAAGNSGSCSDCVGYPAAYDECVAVSATNRDDGLASFSSTGPEVEIAAPGANVESTYLGGTYQTLSGTSMASPHVAGAAGQLVANGYSNEEARSRLNSTAEDVGLPSNEQGNGLLDVPAALGL